MLPYLQQDFYNPSALYLAAKNVKNKLENYRSVAADMLQVRPLEIYFTAGSTEANNTVIHGIMSQYKDAHMIVSSIEHDSVINTASHYNNSLATVDASGLIVLTKLATIITDKTVLISCMSANNEIGTIQLIADIAKIISSIRKERLRQGNTNPIYLHVDASQSFNYLPLLPHALGIDFAVVSGSKIYGPKQTAVLFVKNGIKLDPLIIGGGQERGMRSGTENAAGIAGLVTAMTEADTMRAEESKRLLPLSKQLIEGLKTIQPNCVVNGSLKHRLPNNVHVTFNKVDNETLVMQLDEQGIMVATGSACGASSDTPSHVLRAIGLADEQAKSSIRITMGRFTTTDNIDYFLTVLEGILRP